MNRIVLATAIVLFAAGLPPLSAADATQPDIVIAPWPLSVGPREVKLGADFGSDAPTGAYTVRIILDGEVVAQSRFANNTTRGGGSLSVIVPVGTGSHVATFEADALDEVAESNETNNRVVRSFEVPQWDLAIESIAVRRGLTTGDTYHEAVVTVCNRGADDAPGSNMTLTATPDYGRPHVRWPVLPALAPAECVTRTFGYDMSAVVGRYHVSARVKAAGDVDPSNDAASASGHRLVAAPGVGQPLVPLGLPSAQVGTPPAREFIVDELDRACRRGGDPARSGTVVAWHSFPSQVTDICRAYYGDPGLSEGAGRPCRPPTQSGISGMVLTALHPTIVSSEACHRSVADRLAEEAIRNGGFEQYGRPYGPAARGTPVWWETRGGHADRDLSSVTGAGGNGSIALRVQVGDASDPPRLAQRANATALAPGETYVASVRYNASVAVANGTNEMTRALPRFVVRELQLDADGGVRASTVIVSLVGDETGKWARLAGSFVPREGHAYEVELTVADGSDEGAVLHWDDASVRAAS